MISAALKIGPHGPTAREVFESKVLPQLIESKRSKATITEYRTHISRWHHWHHDPELKDLANPRINRPLVPSVAEGPPVAAIGREDLLAWRRWLPRLLGDDISARTLNKHVGTMLAIISAEMESTPKVPPLESYVAAAKLYMTQEQVSALYSACDVARWPCEGNLPPSDFWKCAIVAWYHYAFRTQELLSFDADKPALRVGQIFLGEETPDPDGQAMNPWGWLSYVPQKQKRHKPRALVLPMNRIVRAHFDLILRSRRTTREEPLFLLPRCAKSFYATWNEIVRAARVKPKPALDGTPRFFLPNHMRKTAITWLNQHRPGIAPFITGHAATKEESASAVSDRHYDHQENRILEALTTYPQPAAFESIFERGDKQLLLF